MKGRNESAPAKGRRQVEACPTFVLRADVREHLLYLICIVRMVREWSTPDEALERKLREFELYVESHPH